MTTFRARSLFDTVWDGPPLAVPEFSDIDYRGLVECAGDVLYAVDLQGRMVFMNAASARVLGATREEMRERLGRPFVELLTPETAATAVRHFRLALEGNEVTPFFEVDLYRKDGSIVNMEIRAANLYRDGKHVGRQGIARDISELKGLREKVEKQSQRIAFLEERDKTVRALYESFAQVSLSGEHKQRQQRAEALRLGLDDIDLQILQELVTGASNAAIAGAVHLSPHTVKDRIARLRAALGATGRAGLVAEAFRRALVR